MRSTFSINATWICDRQFLLPTLLSIYSFQKYIEAPVHLIYTGDDFDLEELQTLLPSAQIHCFIPPNFSIPKRLNTELPTIHNRLTRMFALASCPQNEYLLLIDSDTIFDASIPQLLNHLSTQKGMAGVVEHAKVGDAYLYFATKTQTGSTHSISQQQKNRVFENVFGDNWTSLIKAPQFNNGFLVFWNVPELAEQWQSYYLKGLDSKWINPKDDQVPLAIAAQQLGIPTISLPEKFNSKGAIYGQYVVYHAWLGRWKWDLIKIACQEYSKLSNYGEIALQYWSKLPLEVVRAFWNEHIQEFQYPQLLRALKQFLKKGDWVVELNSMHCYSSFWIAEYAGEFELNYDLILDKYCPDELSIGFLMYTLQKNNFWQYCNAFFDLPQQCFSNYDNNSIDLLLIGLPANYTLDFVADWWLKIKKGGHIFLMDLNNNRTIDLSLEGSTIQSFSPLYIYTKK